MKAIIALLCLFFLSATAEIYFQEEFGDGWENRWVASTFKGDEAGKLGVSAGKHFNDAEADKGLQTQQDLKFYQVSAAFPEFSNKGKTLVLQYSVKHEQNLDCGGGYVKILPAGLDQSNFNGDSEYNIMFGPDICGSTKKVHLILTYKGKNYLLKKDVRAETDTFSHVYTAIINPDQTYKILIDNKEVRSGSLLEDWDFLPPKEIKDPAVSKPADWVDEKEIADPEAKKPEGWDDIPAQIPDPDAQKPDDWDDELDGEWTAPTIANPEYKGEWKAPKIPNPEYKGEWVHPLIPNPDYKEDPEIYAFNSNKYIGIEIWQVKSGTIFDNFLITDDVEVASEWAKKTDVAREAEKKAHEEAEKARKAELEKQGIDESDDEIDVESLEGLAGEEDLHDEL